MKPFAMLALLFAANGVMCHAQVKDFLMFAGKREIGTLTVERIVDGEQTIYRSENHTTVSFIKKFTLKHTIYSTFHEGKLIQAEVTVRLNDNLREHAITEWKGTRYEVRREGEDPFFIDGPISNTSLSIYFHEPLDFEKVYSEQYGIFNDIRKSGNGVYTMDRPDNRTNLYFYRDGGMVRADFETMLFTARAELQ